MNLRSRRLPRGQWLVFSLLVTISVVMMGVSNTRPVRTLSDDVNFMLNPVEVWLNGVGDTAQSYWSTLSNLDSVASENDRLKAENEKLQEELGRMPGIARLNDDWTRISQAQQNTSYQTLVAAVVMRDISDVRQKTIVINRGRADGITTGQVIVDDGGALVGRVKTVNTYDSTVLLVNDFSAVVIGEESQTRAIGTLTGQVGGLLNMQYVSANKALLKGDSVVTAGMSSPGGDVTSPYPKGLLVGTIVSVTTDPNQSYQSAIVQPSADLEGIDFVLVIVNYKGGFPSALPSLPSSSSSPTVAPAPSATTKPTTEPTPGRATPIPTSPPGVVTPPPHG